MAKSLREQMPLVSAFIDDMRAVFGAEAINNQIRAGLGGAPAFHASEGGHDVGTRAPARDWLKLSETVVGDLGAKTTKEAR